MKPIKEFLFDPNPEIGGAVIPIVGMPGSGKTIGLTQIAIKNIEKNNYVLWRGTKQAQWDNLLANDIDIVLWNHESIENFDSFITTEETGEKARTVDLEKKGVTINSWKDPKNLIKRINKNVVNVVNIGGLNTIKKSDLFFFRKKWVELMKALIQRRSGSVIAFLFDEMGDVAPCQGQLRKPFHKLIAVDMPSLLAQMRKKRIFLYAAGHSTHDMHFYLWKIKSNSLLYMSGSVIKKQITPQVDQSIISKLNRGDFVMPPADKGHFNLPREANDLDWIPNNYYNELNLDWTSNCENYLDAEEDEEQMTEMDIKKKLAKQLYNDDNLDLSYRDIGDLLDISKDTVGNVINN